MHLIANRTCCCILMTLLLVTVVAAQTPVFYPIVPSVQFTRALAVDGRIYAGLDLGGVVEFDPTTGQYLRHLDRAGGLGGHVVQDLAWSGTRLLVATQDGGITAISQPGTANEFMQLYATGLSSLNVTCVTGQQVGDSERIFYGTAGNGIGVIEGGREGAYYSSPQLIDNTIEHLALSDGVLLISTPAGLSRFADNVFTSYPRSETGWPAVNDLAVAPDGTIWAATSGGIFTWNNATETLENVHGNTSFLEIQFDGDVPLAMGWNWVVRRLEGGGFNLTLPAVDASLDLDVRSMVTFDGEIWVGGSVRDVADAAGSVASRAWLARAGSTDATIHELEGSQLGIDGGYHGAAVDQYGRAWVGDRKADGVGGLDDEWYHILSVASADNGYRGLLDHSGDILAMSSAGPWIWFNQYTNGIVGFRPAPEPGGEEQWLQLNKFNSPLQPDGIVALGGHPDGAVLVCSDVGSFWENHADNANLGVDVLFDLENPLDESSWLHIPPSDLGGGNVIREAVVERRDVVWFAIEGVGLMRWDINGPTGGPESPLTWGNTADDEWAGPFRYLQNGTQDLATVTQLAIQDDGSVWAGGAGLTRFVYSLDLDVATFIGEWGRKDDAFTPGLLNGSVKGLAFDRNQDLWILSEAGLNRFHLNPDDDNDIDVDSFTDLVTYTTLDWSFYSPGAIAPLPGGTYRDLDVAADGTRLVLTSDLGGVMLDVPERQDEVGSDASEAYLYPNPFPGDDGAGAISIGGLAIDDDTPIDFEVLNLTGQIVYKSRGVTAAEAIWDGRNRLGERVASGLYVLKITQGRTVRTHTLAVTF